MFLKSKIGIVLFCLIGSSFFSTTPGKAVHDFSVVVQPRRISTRASYLLTLKLDVALEVHDWIKVIWPKEAKLPVLPEDPSERKLELKRIIESIFIGTSPCSACQGYPEINYKENSIRFNIHLELNPEIHGYEEINITITDRVGIINPSKPGTYELKIATAKEQTTTRSIPFEIVESRIGDPEGIPSISVVPNGNHVKAAYQITFNVGKGGALVFNQSRIRIQFSKETILLKKPNEIEPYLIKINGKPVVNKIMISDQVLTFISPINSENSDKLTIHLDPEVGIINPNKPGQYTLFISTSEDPDWIESYPYEISENVEMLSVEPNKTNRHATYQFQFLTNQKLEDYDPIYILFPSTVVVPMSIDKEFIKVNHETPSSLSISNNLIMLYIKKTLDANFVLSIEFSDLCQIKNPSEACFVRLGYKIANQTEFLYTREILIEKTIISIQSIEIEPANAKAIASYQFTLLVDIDLGISPDSSLNIEFPEGTTLPEEIKNSQIFINNKNPVVIERMPPHTISLKSDSFFLFDNKINIKFSKECGIINPDKGNQTVQFIFYSSIEPDLQSKKDVFMYPSLPVTEIQFKNGLTGNNDWFIKAPILDFQKSEDCITYFFWNGREENVLEFVEPTVIPDGQYQTIISYYSESPYGKEEIKTVTIKVDTIHPVLTISKPEFPLVKTNKTSLLIEGSSLVQEFSLMGETIKIYDKKLLIDDKLYGITKGSGIFSFQHSISPENTSVKIQLEDEAGNLAKHQFDVLFKLQTPNCEIIEPKDQEWIMVSNLLVKGITEPESLVKFNKKEELADDRGYFQIEVTTFEIGLNPIKIDIIDPYGNMGEFTFMVWYGYSMHMQINSLNATNNNKKIKLDLAPFIREERTMVPFRFLGEQLQAIISYEVDSKTKLVSMIQYVLDEKTVQLFIGKKEGIVNGDNVLLDTAPFIMKGRTLVPLRFISENLGCKTLWDPNTKSILVQYAKKG